MRLDANITISFGRMTQISKGAKMPYVTKEDIEVQKALIAEHKRQFEEDVPAAIRQIVQDDGSFAEFINQIEEEKNNFNDEQATAQSEREAHLNAVEQREEAHISLLVAKSEEINQTISQAEDTARNHIITLEQKRDGHIAEFVAKGAELQTIHQQHLDHCSGRKDELTVLESHLADKESAAINAVADAEQTSINNMQTELNSNHESLNKATESHIKRIQELTEDFRELAGAAYSNKSSDKIADEYRKNAKSHKKDETKFQYIGGGSIIGAIVILLVWLTLVIYGLVSTESEYHWLPVATITSLFIFLSRWSARIAYRHGLEARRLNQFALELTAMPAFFAQELMNQGDTEFQTAGKKIVQEKSSKMFGNFERFDEQHSHNAMELVWKWVTKKFETSEEKEATSALKEEEPIHKSKPAPKKKGKTDAPPLDE